MEARDEEAEPGMLALDNSQVSKTEEDEEARIDEGSNKSDKGSRNYIGQTVDVGV